MPKTVLILLFSLIILTFALPALTVQAGTAKEQFNSGLKKTGVPAGYDPNEKFEPADWAGKVIGAILAFVGIIFLGLMIYGGMRWMTAQGREQDVADAQKTIKAAVVGLVIVLLAYVITAYVGSLLEGLY